MTYRKDLDFLRALAMVGIFLYHMSMSGLSGGYVFLELFFVISGYLISSIIISKIEADKFSIKSFYINRFFRLFPALIVTIIGTIIAGYFILSPDHFKNLGGSAVLGTISLSNVYFWTQVDYFDLNKYLKPLLHTWSLGVEEQFYLIWPAILVFALGFKRAVKSYYICLLILFFVSLGISIYWSYSESMSAGAYYLIPSRIYEFALGALIAKAGPFKNWDERLSVRLSDALFISGLGLIALAVITFKESFAFPGYLALLPCMGAVLCILGGAKSRAADMLSNRATVFIGQISYSLYLVHWPLIVYFKYGQTEPLSALQKTIIFALAFALASLLHYAVEQPFRQKSTLLKFSRKTAGRLSLTALLGTAAAASHIYVSQGWLGRYNQDIQTLIVQTEADYKDRQRTIRGLECHFTQMAPIEELIERLPSCNPVKAKNIIIIGDSFAGDLYGALSAQRPDLGFIQFSGAGCMVDPASQRSADGCKRLYNAAQEFIAAHKDHIEGIIYKTRFGGIYDYRDFKFKFYDFETGPFTPQMQSYVTDTIDYFEPFTELGIPVVWLGTNSELSLDFRQILSQSPDVEAALKTARGSTKTEELNGIDAGLSERLKSTPIHYISEQDICQGPCPQLTETGDIVVPDFGHWGAKATPYMGKVVIRSPAFRDALPVFEPDK